MVDEPKVTLIVQDGVVDYDQAHYALQRFPFTIGRDPGCDLVLPLNIVSRLHAQIERYHSGYVLRDLDSPNGTFVNGMRINVDEPRRMKDGDLIGLGSPQPLFKYRDQNETFEVVELRLSEDRAYYYSGSCLRAAPGGGLRAQNLLSK